MFLFPNEELLWQDAGVAYGNVILQLCSISSTIWLSDEMNDYQQSELNKILEQINMIRQKYNIPIEIEVGRPTDFKKRQECLTLVQKHYKTACLNIMWFNKKHPK